MYGLVSSVFSSLRLTRGMMAVIMIGHLFYRPLLLTLKKNILINEIRWFSNRKPYVQCTCLFTLLIYVLLMREALYIR